MDKRTGQRSVHIRVPPLWRSWARAREEELSARGWRPREARRNARLEALARAHIGKHIGLAAARSAEVVWHPDGAGEPVLCFRISLRRIPPQMADRAAAFLAPAFVT